MRTTDEDFVRFVDANSERLLRAAWLMTGSPSTAEDLVATTFERVYVRWRRLDRSRALAYARKVLLNEHIDQSRRRSRELVLSDLPEPERPEPTAAPSEQTQADSAAYLITALRQLTERERQVVVMRHYADLSEADVASALGVSLGTVKSTASRGLARLRKLLAVQGDSHVS